MMVSYKVYNCNVKNILGRKWKCRENICVCMDVAPVNNTSDGRRLRQEIGERILRQSQVERLAGKT